MSITETQNDAITEVINIGVGKAAAVLSDMTEQKIGLQIPKVSLLTPGEVTKILSGNNEGHAAVKVNFEGLFSGVTSIVFSQESATRLVSLLVGEDDISDDELDDLMQETLNEVGNIVINSIMGSISNILETKIDYQLPEYVFNTLENILFKDESEKEGEVLLAHTQFLIQGKQIEGKIMILLRGESLTNLIQGLEKQYS